MSTSTTPAGLHPQWAIHPGGLQPLVHSYVDHLVAHRYPACTIHYLQCRARHFCYWLNQSGIAVACIDDRVIDGFAQHSCRCPGKRASKILSSAYIGSVRKFVNFLEQSQIVHLPPSTTGDGRIQLYLDWLRQHRGLSEDTITGRRKLMKQLLPLLGPDPRTYDAARVRSLVVTESQRRSSVNIKNLVAVLRSYLRYLATQDSARQHWFMRCQLWPTGNTRVFPSFYLLPK